jgi:hypothetical protein
VVFSFHYIPKMRQLILTYSKADGTMLLIYRVWVLIVLAIAFSSELYCEVDSTFHYSICFVAVDFLSYI